MTMIGKCDCCLREVGETFVCSSAVGPASFAYCNECLRRNAEPELSFHYLYDFVSSDGEGLHEGIKSLCTYKAGAYVTWEDWVKWRQTEPQKATLDQKRDDDLKELESYGEQ